MKNKNHRIVYLMQCPNGWWSRRRQVWVSGNIDLKEYVPFSSCRRFRTKVKALRSLGQMKLPGAFVEQELITKKGHHLIATWTKNEPIKTV